MLPVKKKCEYIILAAPSLLLPAGIKMSPNNAAVTMTRNTARVC